MYLCMYVRALVIAPLQDFYSEALPTTARTLNRSFTPKRMSNCELRTCPGSLRDGLRWIRTRNPPAARHQTYPYTTAPHNIYPSNPFTLTSDGMGYKRVGQYYCRQGEFTPRACTSFIPHSGHGEII